MNRVQVPGWASHRKVKSAARREWQEELLEALQESHTVMEFTEGNAPE